MVAGIMLFGPLALVFGPVLYIFLAVVSLAQFKVSSVGCNEWVLTATISRAPHPRHRPHPCRHSAPAHALGSVCSHRHPHTLCLERRRSCTTLLRGQCISGVATRYGRWCSRRCGSRWRLPRWVDADGWCRGGGGFPKALRLQICWRYRRHAVAKQSGAGGSMHELWRSFFGDPPYMELPSPFPVPPPPPTRPPACSQSLASQPPSRPRPPTCCWWR